MRQATQSFGQAAAAKIRYAFRPREIIFRSEGRVGCIRLSTRWQISVTLVGAAAALWLISSSLGWLMSQQRLAAIDPELRHTRQAYTALLAEVQQNYRQVASLAEDLQGGSATPSPSAERGGGIAAARAALKQKLEGFQSDLQRLVDLNRTLNSQITELTERVQAGEADKHRLVEAGSALEERVRRLSLALASANDEHQTLTGRIALLEGQMALSQRTQQVLVSAVEQAQMTTAAWRGSLVHRNVLYPLQKLWNGNGPEDALVLAVMRQESHFSMTAISPAGARGMMQLMPDTAREMAMRMNIGYTIERLTSDADFNIALGRAYLDQLLNLFDRSYVLAIAAYNAGPARVLEWMHRFGDPRDPSIDVRVWVQSIPYTETRIYVQRVMQNLQDYRDRLNTQAADRCSLAALNSRAS